MKNLIQVRPVVFVRISLMAALCILAVVVFLAPPSVSLFVSVAVTCATLLLLLRKDIKMFFIALLLYSGLWGAIIYIMQKL